MYEPDIWIVEIVMASSGRHQLIICICEDVALAREALAIEHGHEAHSWRM